MCPDFFGLDVRPTCLTAPVKLEADTRHHHYDDCDYWMLMIKIKMMVMNILAMVIKMMMAMANVHNLSKGKVVKTCIFIICFSFLIICILFIIISHHQFNMLRVIIKTLKSP